ncbi:MAG: DUF2752 domain-containing protein [Acutalibacteraceae bacterium]|nr:DUF2752 domain-containing protein [Acutalibacteraceae bacterium]
MKSRLKKVGISTAVIITVGLAYFLICNKIGFGIPCFIYQITGLKCGGCGVSRLCISLLKGDVHSAWQYNRATMLMLPAIAYLCIREIYLYIRYDNLTLKKWERILTVVVVVVLLAFAVLRNIFGW